ncbi:MAG: damage repair protein [Bacilli bacterium]|nr:damage repair protein [Bacilli bacterium]MDD4406465.1 damage repair protein [Bacilli bacterium]
MENINVKRSIIAIDLKSFFAACECIERKLDMFTTPLIVCSNNKGAMTLAVTPYLKKFGINGRTRIYDLPKNIKYLKVPPRMGLYHKKSNEVIKVYEEFISSEDMHIYSIDEVFLDVTNYLSLYKKTPYELALFLLEKVKEKTGLIATAGIGPNIILAKVAMDLDAKNNKNNIALWSFKDIKTKLWKIEPLSKMWGIGFRMEKNLNSLGIFSIKDLACFNKNILKEKYGVLGLELWNHANGIDLTTIIDLNKEPKNKSISHGQVLFKDYNEKNITLIIRETIDLLTKKLRETKKRTSSVCLSIKYSKNIGGGFSKRVKLDNLTKDSKDIYLVCMNIFDKYYEYLPIRQITIQLGGLIDDIGQQLSLFETYEEITTVNKTNQAIDFIKTKYGPNSILKASSLLDDSTIISRNIKNGY